MNDSINKVGQQIKGYVKTLKNYPFSSWHLIIFQEILIKTRPWQWMIISFFIRQYIKNKKVSKVVLEKKFNKVIIFKKNTPKISDQNYNEYIKNSTYAFADTYLEDWIKNNLKVEIKYISFKNIFSDASTPGAVVALQPEEPSIMCVREIFRALLLKKKGLPVIAFITDTYIASHGIMAGIYVAITGGVTIFLQSSKSEAAKFGYPFPVAPIFWTFPKSRYSLHQSYSVKKSWEMRKNQIILPSGGADAQRRFEIGKLLETRVLPQHYSCVKAGGLPKYKYLELLSQSKLYFTTSLVQKKFLIGPKIYRDRISDFTVTGQVWEAFASSCVVITNKCEALEEIGFIASTHYLDLDVLISEQKKLPTEYQLMEIALVGNLLFEKLISKEINFH